MARQVITGIDIGSSQVKVIIAEGTFVNKHFTPKIIALSTAETRGVERGYIVDSAEAAASIQTAVARAEKTAGFKVRRAYVSFGGLGLGSVVGNASRASL